MKYKPELLLAIIFLVTAAYIWSGYTYQLSQTYQPLPSDQTAPDHVVTMTKDGFSPMEITIPVGATVTWKNMEMGRSETIKIIELNKASPTISYSRPWTYTFATAGEYNYYSIYYNSLKGKVIVK